MRSKSARNALSRVFTGRNFCSGSLGILLCFTCSSLTIFSSSWATLSASCEQQRLHNLARDKSAFFERATRIIGPTRSAAGVTWYTLYNVCVNENDYIKYLPWCASEVVRNLTRDRLLNVTEPLKMKLIDWSYQARRSAIFLRGKSIVVQCWRSSTGNPSHLMFGLGKLYTMFTDNEMSFQVDNIVLHQCSYPNSSEVVTFLLLDVIQIIKRGFLHNSSKLYITSKMNDASRKNLCLDESLVSFTFPGLSLGSNSPSTVQAWRRDVVQYETQQRHTAMQKASSIYTACVQKLRVSVFKRTSSGKNKGLRKFENLKEVLQLINTYSKHTQVISFSGVPSFQTVYDAFNSFDILITPHGSHLTNGILISNGKPSIIEVAGTCINADFQRNLQPHFAHYHMSTGHLTLDGEVDKDIVSAKKG